MAAPIAKKLVRSKSGLKVVTVDEKMQSPFMISEPQWILDSTCKVCQNVDCKSIFNFINRKHHCRRCGKCFCNNCTSSLLAIPRMCFIDPVRHCQSCAQITRTENEFFSKHLNVLFNGGVFRILDDNDDPGDGGMVTCRLSHDHMKLEFSGEKLKRESIWISKIENLKFIVHESDLYGNKVGTGISLQYNTEAATSGQCTIVRMAAEGGLSKKSGIMWITALHKAFKMIHDSTHT